MERSLTLGGPVGFEIGRFLRPWPTHRAFFSGHPPRAYHAVADDLNGYGRLDLGLRGPVVTGVPGRCHLAA